MDIRLEAAFDVIKYQQTLINQRDLLEAWLNESLQYSNYGGTFKITPQLMVFVKLLVDNHYQASVIIDEYNTPILVENLQEFLETLLEIYATVTNEYYVKFQELRKKRNVKDLVGWGEES
ncbi:MAG: hypothetical protein HC836_10835 [Richelia sp. RM2_1_2]|nr:hypothetical protein [Richelia sp. RM2_1_2]